MATTNRSVNYKIAMTGVFGALSVVLAFTPLGYIQLGGLIAITIMHIPVILATVLAGLVPGIGVGLIFGISSLIRAVTTGTAPFFLNPLVSIVPRMAFPVAVWAVYRLLCLIPRMPRPVSGAVAAAAGTFAHTLLVMGAIYLLYGADLLAGMQGVLEGLGYRLDALTPLGGFIAIMAATLATNGIWEIIAATVLVAAVLSPLYAAGKRKSRLRSEEEQAAGR